MSSELKVPRPKNSALRMTVRAMKSDTCVNLKCVQQSPTANTCLRLVCRRSLTCAQYHSMRWA